MPRTFLNFRPLVRMCHSMLLCWRLLGSLGELLLNGRTVPMSCLNSLIAEYTWEYAGKSGCSPLCNGCQAQVPGTAATTPVSRITQAMMAGIDTAGTNNLAIVHWSFARTISSRRATFSSCGCRRLHNSTQRSCDEDSEAIV